MSGYHGACLDIMVHACLDIMVHACLDIMLHVWILWCSLDAIVHVWILWRMCFFFLIKCCDRVNDNVVNTLFTT